MDEKTHSLWNTGAEDSRFEGGYFSQIGHRLMCFAVFPGVPAGALLGILAAGGHRALLAAVIVFGVLCFVCGTAAAALRIKWGIGGIRIDGVTLTYNGGFKETALFLLKTRSISLLAVVLIAPVALLLLLGLFFGVSSIADFLTAKLPFWFGMILSGLFWALLVVIGLALLAAVNAPTGFATAAVYKFIYRRAAPAGKAANPDKSGFVGNFLHIMIPRVLITTIPAAIMMMTGLIPFREKSEAFYNNYLTLNVANSFKEPAMKIWTMLKYIVNQGFSVLRVPSGVKNPYEYPFYQETTTIIWTAILIFIALLVLWPWYRYKTMKWEIENTVVDGYQMSFKAKLNDYFIHWFSQGFLVVITLGLYGLLGFFRVSMWRFRAKHTHVFIPASGQAKPESYIVSAEKLNMPWRDRLRSAFNESARKKNASYFKRYWTLYALLLIPLVYIFIFKYIPMLFIQIGVKENNIALSIWDVPWAKDFGFEHFLTAFKSTAFIQSLRNTLVLNGLDLLFGFPMPIILAILLNELAFRRFKRISQTIFYMPHFLSWVIISALALQLFKPEVGLVNMLIERMSMNSVDPFQQAFQWVVMYVFLGIWQSAGWGTIIYLAAITGINPELYEAANVDGAGRMRKIWHITLPGLRPTIIILLIMRVGGIIGSDFERAFALRNNLISNWSDVISIYVYRYGLRGTQFSLTAAVGIFQSVVGLIFLFATNALAKKFGERGVM